MRINKFDGTNWNTQTVGTDLSNLQVKNFALSGDQKKIILTDTNNNLYSGKYNNTINSFDTITKFSSNDIQSDNIKLSKDGNTAVTYNNNLNIYKFDNIKN